MDWLELRRLNAELTEFGQRERDAERAEDFLLARRYRNLIRAAEFQRARLVRHLTEHLAAGAAA